MKYRWEYLGEYFDTSKSINDIDLPCLHANVDLKKLIIDFNDNTVPDKNEASASKEIKAGEQEVATSNDPVATVQNDIEQKEVADTSNTAEWKEMNVQMFFRNDNAIVIIEKSVVNHMDIKMTDIQDMNIIDFMNLLEKMVEKNVLKSNIYSALKAKFNRLVSQYEGGNEE